MPTTVTQHNQILTLIPGPAVSTFSSAAHGALITLPSDNPTLQVHNLGLVATHYPRTQRFGPGPSPLTEISSSGYPYP